jgi:hypothetical protein
MPLLPISLVLLLLLHFLLLPLPLFLLLLLLLHMPLFPISLVIFLLHFPLLHLPLVLLLYMPLLPSSLVLLLHIPLLPIPLVLFPNPIPLVLPTQYLNTTCYCCLHPWRRKQYLLLKRWCLTTRLQGAISHKRVTFKCNSIFCQSAMSIRNDLPVCWRLVSNCWEFHDRAERLHSFDSEAKFPREFIIVW